ncbi:SAM-dependent methyltransferase [Rhodospirillum rubrum]|uniref:Cyclopropane-fatty-acyl-phospholipid synthase n=1 Tax=Rhodospirillum rubrum (strain ATCC 11170 / ATH 1.1.1 / DSM 467 / LMG 4362 / NCIMB 8255 / S1) TaxID=269796 RepID=Q2RT35_RHORT|nr:cyclopropane-fatty-acyl-phospholipid synthase family protein [Rhodospirillum rubrum]ABC22710.1 cyclopropane-fatty-acyl-phospholipid synthase [Rhodospirillum rubrum ATCC 11170]AEO48429.1 cyclopropane-fatty-acyl-phospholipid synthase [Rhodospirillum rubrum F11]MBK5954308.1 SAM-dependent methyltransferase [Rhodospirillum rubrum]QXG78702.1 cyclopropane-fatty-acyl-phospholipid synthase family protein [Rhodospirillum rubrum]HAP98634.1 class I SAM-dependent methyltransferase [Rhodospirillum rubrum
MLFASLLKNRLRLGQLTMIDAKGQTHVLGGDGPGPRVTIRLTDPSLHRRLFLRPHLAIGEAYMEGTLIIERGGLRDFLELIGANLAAIEGSPWVALGQRLSGLMRRLQQRNPVWRSRRNVAHHYDLSGAFYDLFLDSDRQYSCAYFARDGDSLEQAQDNKKRLIAAKLMLRPGQHVLDIGCGWGGLALHLARHHDVRVTGITLSQEQAALARERVRAAGLQDRVTILLKDYRDLDGRFDRVVSVGMLEHVGAPQLADYFRHVGGLLSDDGVALIHSIGRMEPPGSTNVWIRKYIFPGGYSPALSETLAAVEGSGLYLTDAEILRLHYARTLAEWTRRFQANREAARALYDERFCRMWEFYLLGCEMAFRHGNQMVFQLQLARRQDAVPLTRDYLFETMPRSDRRAAGYGTTAHPPSAAAE